MTDDVKYEQPIEDTKRAMAMLRTPSLENKQALQGGRRIPDQANHVVRNTLAHLGKQEPILAGKLVFVPIWQHAVKAYGYSQTDCHSVDKWCNP